MLTRLINEANAMNAHNWTVAEAKAKFSEVIENARTSGPQTVTRNGRPSAVVVSVEEWERKTRRTGNLATFFAESPLRNADLLLDRVNDPPRVLDF